jgi:hypothetical protein
MKINFTKEQKKYLQLVEELKELYSRGCISEFDYPDMAEINDSLYEYVLVSLGIWKGSLCEIGCQYSLEQLEEKVKEGRKKCQDLKEI